MSLYANCSRGEVQVVDMGDGGNALYQVEGLSGTLGILIDAVSPMDPGVLDKKHTIDDKKILYTFGPSFGDLLISGTLLHGAGSMGLALDSLQTWYNSVRVSKSKMSVNVSAGVESYKVFITKLMMGGADAEFGIQTFEIHGILAEPSTN